MKRVGGLWEKLVSFENLHEAARRASLGKRKRPDVAAFLFDTENQLIALRRELQSGDYEPGPYREFLRREPKPRRISAEPVFEPRFSPFSYACRTGLGTHQALERFRWAAPRIPVAVAHGSRLV